MGSLGAVKPFHSHRPSIASETASSAQRHARLRSSAEHHSRRARPANHAQLGVLQVSGRTSAAAAVWQKGLRPTKGRWAMPKLDRSLAIGRANYQRWLGTEPEEITAAAEVLRRFAPEHPCLLELDVRLCRARQIKAMLAEILHPELATDNDEDWRRL